MVGSLLLSTSEREILGHDAVLVDSVNARLLEALGESDNLRGAVELSALNEASRPGEDGGDRVRRGLAALLVLAEMSGHGAVGSF